MVDHDVEAEDLETKTVFDVVGLARPVQVMDVRLGQAHRLHYDLIDLVEHPLLGLEAVVMSNLVKHELIRALTSNVICVWIIILDEGARLLIDRVVGKVHT